MPLTVSGEPTTHSIPLPPTRPPDDLGEISLAPIAMFLLRHRRLLVRWTVAGILIAIGIGLVLPAKYTATSSFMPQARRQSQGLSGIAAQLGLNLNLGDQGPSGAFYADLLQSRELLGALAEMRFPSARGELALIEILRARGSTPALRRDYAIRRLRDNVTTIVVQKTGVVRLSTRARTPQLALLMNQRLLDLLNRFNLQSRQSQAGSERQFTERRLAEVRQDLRQAEDRVQAFLQRNRDYRNSPELRFEQERLQREVSVQTELFNTLNQAYEQAKIEEVRDTPVITTVEHPELPARRDSRQLPAKGAFGFFAGATLGMLIALLRGGERPAATPDLRALAREAAADIRRPWRVLQADGPAPPPQERGFPDHR